MDATESTPQFDTDELLRQIMGQVSPDPNGNPEGKPAQVPMARNSFGAKVGSQVAPIPKPPQAPVVAEVAPPDPNVVAPPPAQPRLNNPIQMPPAPSAPDPKAVDASGKSKYRMGLGQRIAGTAANFLNGFSRNGQPIIDVGPGARNDKWQQDQDLTETNRKLYETATQGALRQGQIQSYEDRAAVAGQRADTAERALTEKSAQFGKTLEEKQREFDNKKPTLEEDAASRKKIAEQMGLKKGSKEWNTYILTGKMPGQDREGRQPTELETWMAAFRRDNGREPTADEIANKKGGRSSKEDAIEKDKETALDKAETKAQKRISDMKLVDLTDPRSPAERKQAIYDDLEKEKAQIQRNYETRASQNAQRNGPKTPAAGPMMRMTEETKTMPASGGEISTDEAKSYLTKAGWDGKTQPTPELKAKARQLAQKDGRGF